MKFLNKYESKFVFLFLSDTFGQDTKAIYLFFTLKHKLKTKYKI